MGDRKDVRKMTEEEIDHLLVEMLMKMSPGQLAKAAEMIYEAAKENQGKKEAS